VDTPSGKPPFRPRKLRGLRSLAPRPRNVCRPYNDRTFSSCGCSRLRPTVGPRPGARLRFQRAASDVALRFAEYAGGAIGVEGGGRDDPVGFGAWVMPIAALPDAIDTLQRRVPIDVELRLRLDLVKFPAEVSVGIAERHDVLSTDERILRDVRPGDEGHAIDVAVQVGQEHPIGLQRGKQIAPPDLIRLRRRQRQQRLRLPALRRYGVSVCRRRGEDRTRRHESEPRLTSRPNLHWMPPPKASGRG
jgi:hypothetical protein